VSLLPKRGSEGSRRLLFTFADQGISSTSNFAVGLAIARLAGPTEFGAYMLVFTLWLVVLGCHRAIVTEPIIVSTAGRDAPETVSHGVSAELLLGAAVSALALIAGLACSAAGAQIATPMLAMSPWFVFLLVQDYWRAMAFRQRRPGLALVNDSVYAVVQVVAAGAFWLLGWRSVGSMITAWGIGAAAGAFLGLIWFPATYAPRAGQELVRRLWHLGRWLLLDYLASFASDYSYLILVAGLLSGVAYGGFRAAYNLLGPMLVLVLAAANIGLPAAAAHNNPDDPEELRRFARRLSALSTICIAAYGLGVAVAGDVMLRVLYGPKFAGYGFLATLTAVQYVVTAMVLGQGVALKAAGKLRRLWRIRTLMAIASLISTFFLVRWFGVDGAGWGTAATGVYYSAGVWWLYRRELVHGGDHDARFATRPATSVVTFGSIMEAAEAAAAPPPSPRGSQLPT